MIDRLAETASKTPWFSQVGTQLGSDIRAEAARYTSLVNGSPLTIVPVEGWLAARRWLGAEGCEAHRAEEDLEAERLRRQGVTLYAPGLLDAVIDTVVRETEDHALGAAANMAAKSALKDGSVVRLAASEAARAVRHACTALATGETEHPFLDKLGLFGVGRWPVARMGSYLYIF